MEAAVIFGLALVAGLAIAAYGVNGILTRRILFMSRGDSPRLCEGEDAVAHGIVVTALGCGFALVGGLLLLISLTS